MNDLDKSKEQLIKELKKLQQKYDSLKEILKEDSTEDKQTKKVLQESEDKFRTVADFTYDWEYWINTEGKIMYISPSCERITGYTPKEFLQNPELFTRIIHPDDKDIFKNHVHRVLGTNEMEPINFRIITKNNEERWIGHICQSVYDNNGNNLGQRGSNRDITERIQTEEALKLSETQLKEAQRMAVIGNWELNLVTDELIWSDEIYHIFEIDKEKIELSFEAFLNAIHPDDRDTVKEVFNFSVENRNPYEIGHRIQMTDGRVKYVHEHCKTHYNAEGKPLRSVGTVQDITKRKQAEEIITTQKKRLVYILKGTNVGTWEWNIQTGETVFDERWAEIIGYQLEEISPLSIETWRKFSHPDDLIVSDELLEKHFSGELDYYECESRMKHKNGDWKWILIHCQ